MQHNIYLYNNLHNGDIITNRALIKELLKYPQLNIAVGCYYNHFYLYEDLFVRHIVSLEEENFPLSSDLRHLCPSDFAPINTHCGTFADLDALFQHNWINVVETFNRQAKNNNIDIRLYAKEVPSIDFNIKCNIKLAKRGIYIENGHQRSGPRAFEFDLDRFCTEYPDINFYCTATPNINKENAINCCDKNLIQLSHISNLCDGIMGKGSGPFLCTYTEINKTKPRALCGYDLKHSKRLWDCRDVNIQYLYTLDSMLEFIDEIYNTKYEYIGDKI